MGEAKRRDRYDTDFRVGPTTKNYCVAQTFHLRGHPNAASWTPATLFLPHALIKLCNLRQVLLLRGPTGLDQVTAFRAMVMISVEAILRDPSRDRV